MEKNEVKFEYEQIEYVLKCFSHLAFPEEKDQGDDFTLINMNEIPKVGTPLKTEEDEDKKPEDKNKKPVRQAVKKFFQNLKKSKDKTPR